MLLYALLAFADLDWATAPTACLVPDYRCLLCSGNRQEMDNVAMSWLEMLVGMLLCNLPVKLQILCLLIALAQ